MSKSLIKTGTSNEWLTFISRLGLVNLDQARSVFISGDYTQLSDLGQKALYTTGRGKVLSLEGNLTGSKMTFDEAILFAETRNEEAGYPHQDEILAYATYELAGFLQKYGEGFRALSLYRSSRRMAESSDLTRTIDYQLTAMSFEANRGKTLDDVLEWVRYFKENDMQIMHLISTQRLAAYYRRAGDTEQALYWIHRSLKQAYDYGHTFMIDQMKNIHAFIKINMGELEAAREILLPLVETVEGNYLKSAMLENLTLSYYQDQDYEASSHYIGKAIEHSQKYDVLTRLISECLFMGELQRDIFNHPEMATHYFEQGYRAAIKMSEHGFSLKGDRLNVLRAFEERPKTSYSIPETVGTPAEPFAFAIGRRWKEILDLFHFTLIRTHLMAGDGSAILPDRLGLKTSTYYAIKRRLGQVGFDFDLSENRLPISVNGKEFNAFKIYVSKLQPLNWADANAQFESEIIEFLFKHAGYQKTKLAEDLDLSYPTVLQKTKSLTMSE